MALPQKAVEQLAREPVRTPGGLSRLLLFSSAVFFIVAFVYLGLRFGYRPYLTGQSDRIERDIQTFRQRIPASDQERLLQFASQITHVQAILKGYREQSRALTWLEDHTHPQVLIAKFDLDAARRLMELHGSAASADDVGEQLIVFRSADEVEEVSFGGMRADRGFWSFDVTLTLRDPLFKSP